MVVHAGDVLHVVEHLGDVVAHDDDGALLVDLLQHLVHRLTYRSSFFSIEPSPYRQYCLRINKLSYYNKGFSILQPSFLLCPFLSFSKVTNGFPHSPYPLFTSTNPLWNWIFLLTTAFSIAIILSIEEYKITVTGGQHDESCFF